MSGVPVVIVTSDGNTGGRKGPTHLERGHDPMREAIADLVEAVCDPATDDFTLFARRTDLLCKFVKDDRFMTVHDLVDAIRIGESE
jgi:hypothetical protein